MTECYSAVIQQL